MYAPAAFHSILSASTKAPAIILSQVSAIEATQAHRPKLSLDTILNTVQSVLTPKLKELSPTSRNTLLNASHEGPCYAADAMSADSVRAVADSPVASVPAIQVNGSTLSVVTTRVGPKSILKTRFATAGQSRKKAVIFNDQVQIIEPMLDADGLAVPACAAAIIPSPRYPTQPSSSVPFGLLNRALHPLRTAQILKLAAKSDVGTQASPSSALSFTNTPSWAVHSPLPRSRCGSAVNMPSPNIFLTSPSVFA